MFKQIFNPNIYHGFKKRGNYFEGWYFKVTSADGQIFAFIPGVYLSTDKNQSFSFIQIFEGNKANIDFIRYSKEDFSASGKEFYISIDKNNFLKDRVQLNISSEKTNVIGELQFTNLQDWPDSIINPGSMGFYNYLPFMECYSQVTAMSGDVEGNLIINGANCSFNGGKVYIEKNWGRAFPYSYLWIQCNNFKKRLLSVSASIGHVPMPLGSFNGFLIGLSYESSFYKFTTINRSSLDISYEGNRVIVNVQNKQYKLNLNCRYEDSAFAMLYAPKNGSMYPLAKETLRGYVELTLTEKISGKIIVEDSGINAGIEFCGDYTGLF